MANPVEGAVETVTQPVKWAKAKPIAFAVMLFLLVLLALRFAAQIRSFLAATIGRIPVVGTAVMRVAGAPASSTPPATP